MINYNILFFALLLLLLAFLGKKLLRLSKELNEINCAIRKSVRRDKDFVRDASRETALKSLKNLVALLLSERSKSKSTSDNYSEFISLSSSIPKIEKNPEVLCSHLSNIFKKGMPEIASWAVILKKANDQLRVMYIEGTARERMIEPLLIFLESNDNVHTSYYVPPRNSLLDFSTFGIGVHYFFPFLRESKLCGYAWFGLKQGATTLSQENKFLLDSLCMHLHAGLDSSLQIKERIDSLTAEKKFILGLSHDLRSPGNCALLALKSILQYENNNLSGEQLQSISIAEEGIEEQLDILNDLLDLAKFQSDKLLPTPSEFCLKEAITEVYKVLAPQALHKQIDFIIDVDDITVFCDRKHCKRILTNLISNALKYTPDGFVKITTLHNENDVCISIEDSGLGIPIDKRKLLFSEFERFSFESDIDGAGFGLLISKMLAEQNKGSISHRENKPTGSIFTFTVPRARTSRTRKNIDSILVVDDDPYAGRFVLKQVKEISNANQFATTPEEALHYIESCPPSLLITDFNFKTKTANDLFRALEILGVTIPTIITTGEAHADSLNIPPSIKYKILEKPFDKESLLACVDAVLT